MAIAGIKAGPGLRPDFERTSAASGRRGLSLALLLSLALHLLPLFFWARWSSTPVEVPAPIPVALVLEQPPPSPPAPVAPAETAAVPARGRLASEEVGAPADAPNDDAAPQSSESRPAAEPNPPTAPEPELRQAASLVQPQHQPTLLDREVLALPAPDVEPLPEKPVEPVPSRQPGPRPRPPRRAAAVAGPPAARDAYLAHLVALVRPHLRLLSPEMLNGRRGTTSLAIRVLGDGTIARIAVSQSSGYPDIDARVIQVVAAVGRFPPLPPWIEQPGWDINFHLRFPFPRAATGRP